MTAEPPDARPSPARLWLVLAVAVAGVSSSALLVRGMEADPLAIAAWRTLLATLVLGWPLVRARGHVRAEDVAWSAVAGVLLGVHFWAWFASVKHTTILRSTLLVCLTPGWTALLEWAVHRRRPSFAPVAGLAVALPGLALLAGPGGQGSAFGDGLAVFAGALWSAYLLVGQRVRRHLDAGPYMGLVCGWAALVLFGAALGTQTPVWGFPGRTWLLLGAAVALPQLLGHQGFAWAVKYVPPSTLSALTLLEPVGAVLLAAAFLAERPTSAEGFGMVLVLAGTWVATRSPPAAAAG